MLTRVEPAGLCASAWCCARVVDSKHVLLPSSVVAALATFCLSAVCGGGGGRLAVVFDRAHTPDGAADYRRQGPPAGIDSDQ